MCRGHHTTHGISIMESMRWITVTLHATVTSLVTLIRARSSCVDPGDIQNHVMPGSYEGGETETAPALRGRLWCPRYTGNFGSQGLFGPSGKLEADWTNSGGSTSD